MSLSVAAANPCQRCYPENHMYSLEGGRAGDVDNLCAATLQEKRRRTVGLECVKIMAAILSSASESILDKNK